MSVRPTGALKRAGFRFGRRGTQSTRPMLLDELSELLAALPRQATLAEYKTAVVGDNVLGKPTRSARITTGQCLAQLYGLDPGIPIFRVLRRLWALGGDDLGGRPLLAMLTALARDPLLRLTAEPILTLPAESALDRAGFVGWIRAKTAPRFNDAVLAKVAFNALTSWTRSGHLTGRLQRVRRRVAPTPAAVSLALWMGQSEGLAGIHLLNSRWARVLDLSGDAMLASARDANRLGLIRLRAAGNVVDISTQPLDPEFQA